MERDTTRQGCRRQAGRRQGGRRQGGRRQGGRRHGDRRHGGRRRGVGRWALVGILLLLVVAAVVAILVLRPPPATDLADVPTGALEVELGGAWPVGAFTLTVHDDEPRLTVEHPDAHAEPWRTPPGAAFLTAAAGAPSFRDDHGLLRLADRHEATWTEQTLTAIDEVDGGLVLRGHLATADDPEDRVGWELRLTAPEPQRLHLEAEVDERTVATPVDRLHLTAALEDDERLHGLGGQTGGYDLRGRRVPILAREQGIGRGAQPLTFLVDLAAGAAGGEDTAYLLSTVHVTDRFRSLAYEGGAISSLDLTADDRMTWEVWSDQATFSAVAARTPDGVLEAHAGWIGEPQQPPAWTQEGLIAGLQGGTEAVREKVALLRGADVPLAAVWIQDWSGQRTTDFGQRLQWNWTLDEQRYPGWDELVDELAADGVRVLTYANAFLAADSGAAAAAEGQRDLHSEADANGYLVTGADGRTLQEDQRGFDAALVDLSHPAAREWLAQALADELLDVGASGFMADFAEGPPPGAVLHGGSGLAWRVRWPVLWAELADDAVRRAGLDDEAFVFHRTSHAASAGAARALWLGDQNQDWTAEDGLASVPALLQAASASGFPHVHGDVGGYTSLALPVLPDVARDDELVIRWAEALVLGPVLRTHEGNRPDDVAQPAEDVELARTLGELVRVFVALGPERERLASRSPFATGQHHPWWHAPDEESLADADGLLQLGPDVLLAPVLSAGADTVETVLPSGRWRHVFTDEVVAVDRGSDERFELPAPLGRPALLARVGTAVDAELAEAVSALGR
jgi:sulfoquinovosidase